MNTSPRHRFEAILTLAISLAVTSYAADIPPTWAYGTQPQSPSSAKVPDPPYGFSLHHLPGSSLGFTDVQINDRFNPADWYPPDHPRMPKIVARGRRPTIWACSLCHYPNGKGRPENAAVSGLPVSYFIHQMQDFRNGLRKSHDGRKRNTNLMIAYAHAMTVDEIKTAAIYFGAMPWTSWIKVVETETVPKTRVSVGMYLPVEGSATELIGQRIIEIPENSYATEVLRNPRSGFIAYTPVGSIEKGKTLVTKGAGRTVPCAICHGSDLKGSGPVPGIAGHSPSYLVRQLYDMQQGARRGEWTQLMQPVVSKLTSNEMLQIAAYTASLTP